MVFRFTPSQDLEMMRELIRQKPFAAKRGAMLGGDNVAAALSTALQQKVKVKQIRDRLNLLKARLKANEQASFLASGVEESLDAVNIQSHYSDVDGKVREYVELERLHIGTKAAEKLSKEKKEEDLAKCAADIVAESRRRRIERDGGASDSDLSNSSYAESTVSATESAASVGSAKSTTQRTPKRSNAFLTEVNDRRNAIRSKWSLRCVSWSKTRNNLRTPFFREKIAEARLNFEDRVQASNREMILECAKIFGSELSKSD
ncbi:hypothetical protein GQ600_7401 [Phytophthora cactorum]|nr:hypothetical protein GQ600_7401 [Phytophthora cactorum]